MSSPTAGGGGRGGGVLGDVQDAGTRVVPLAAREAFVEPGHGAAGVPVTGPRPRGSMPAVRRPVGAATSAADGAERAEGAA